MDNKLIFSLSSLSETQQALYRKLLPYRGVGGVRINPTMIEELQTSQKELNALVKANTIFIGRSGGLMVFTSQEDVDKAHPVNQDQRKQESVDRFLRFKEVQEMLIDIAEAHGVDTLHRALVSLIAKETAE